jgi:hypothetical protein
MKALSVFIVKLNISESDYLSCKGRIRTLYSLAGLALANLRQVAALAEGFDIVAIR